MQSRTGKKNSRSHEHDDTMPAVEAVQTFGKKVGGRSGRGLRQMLLERPGATGCGGLATRRGLQAAPADEELSRPAGQEGVVAAWLVAVPGGQQAPWLDVQRVK